MLIVQTLNMIKGLFHGLKMYTVLYHETTFMNDLAQMAEQTGHSTAGEAGKIAAAARDMPDHRTLLLQIQRCG